MSFFTWFHRVKRRSRYGAIFSFRFFSLPWFSSGEYAPADEKLDYGAEKAGRMMPDNRVESQFAAMNLDSAKGKMLQFLYLKRQRRLRGFFVFPFCLRYRMVFYSSSRERMLAFLFIRSLFLFICAILGICSVHFQVLRLLLDLACFD